MCTKNGYNCSQRSSTDLLPSIMGAFDAIIGNKISEKESEEPIKTSTPKRSQQLGNFANLSPGVQKILSHVPEQEISKKFSSEETLGPRRGRCSYRSMRSPEKAVNKSNENLEIISSNVQKMLSNLPDTELVIGASNLSLSGKSLSRNSSYLYGSRYLNQSKQFLYYSDYNSSGVDESDRVVDDSEKSAMNCDEPKPLGTYLHSPQGIASRTPVGRKNMGKFLQVPSESSVGTSSTSNTSTAYFTDGSRPVSLTSLGSCSSSGSSGSAHNQPGSAYLASVESLDSDPEPTGSQGSADSGIAEQEQPSISPEQRVLQEVLDTETVYVADLNEVIQGYLKPWKADPECLLAQHLQHLFSNLEEIYEFNRSFLEDLRRADCDPTKIANVFLQNDYGFSVYNEYCTSYPRTMEVLGKLQRDEKMVPLFREKQMALGHALPLGSYLLKPVQRILKYHLLLQRLSKQCEPAHKPTVDLALATMTGIASDINNMKRKHEHAVRVQEIQSQLYGWTGADLTALGELIAEGTFRVQGARGRRHVFLFEKVLLLAKNKQDGALAYKTHIECSNLMLVEQVRGEPLSFQVLPFNNPRLQCTLRARSTQHKREWTLQIKRAILENYSAVIPNHARQLVMQLGQDVHETEDTSDKWSPLKQYSTPYYLERRSRVRKSRDLSNRRASSQDRTFPSLGSWRRKSEPDMIPQYNSKTLPKKISKIKKSKELSCATFYTDLSDSENGDIAAESTESLAQKTEETEGSKEQIEEKPSGKSMENNLERIVSELLMQNRDFHKMFNREQNRHPRRNINSEPGPMWNYEERPSLPSKADSLPRSFQLHDQIEGNKENGRTESVLDSPLKENPDVDIEEVQENDLSSRLNDNEHPEHKIYRKSTIRLSILQRLRLIMSEEQKRNQKYPLHKQGSKSMGEKIAHPDYVDPQTLFLNSRNSSTVNITLDDKIEDIMGEREELDMSINENEVLNELEKRLNGTNDSSQESENDKILNSSHSSAKTESVSSRNSDGYYESILENSLTEEYVRDSSGKLVAKQESFSNNDRKVFITQRHSHETVTERTVHRGTKPVIKRPTNAPPPIPTKPTRLLAKNISSETVSISSNNQIIVSSISSSKSIEDSIENETNVQTSWVKAMVGRFE